MPSTQELARRLRRVQERCLQARQAYDDARDRYRQACTRTRRCEDALAAEERAGNSRARSRHREDLRNALSAAQVAERDAYSQARRARESLRLRQQDLREEERYLREMEVLSRKPLPAEIVQMISNHNYRGYFDDADL